MIKRLISICLCVMLVVLPLSGCTTFPQKVKIGISFGVGEAIRWVKEEHYMLKRCEELGIEVESRLNKTDTPKTQYQDCVEMIDSGIDVLILTPRNNDEVGEIFEYAKKKKVPVISYARLAQGHSPDLFVGYDSAKMGQKMGKYISEMVYEGNYIILRGDLDDNNANQLYDGAMIYINPIRQSINVILEQDVPNWSSDAAKEMVREAIVKANGKVDAILAPNDKIAQVCAEVVEELEVSNHVVITGMDAELEAIKRIAEETQDMTIYMDLKELANTAINEAYNMATHAKVNVNAEIDERSGAKIPSNLVPSYVVVKKNIDRIIIEGGVYTKEQVYGEE